MSDSAATCVVTHYAVTCQWSCIIVNAVIAMLLRGEKPDLCALMSAAVADGAPDIARHCPGRRYPIGDSIRNRGREHRLYPTPPWLRRQQMLIGHTLLALQCGLWAAETPLDFEVALRQVVAAGGDTDTNAAVAGAVLGARYGKSAIPERWAGVCARA